jgi:hypothetical protein
VNERHTPSSQLSALSAGKMAGSATLESDDGASKPKEVGVEYNLAVNFSRRIVAQYFRRKRLEWLATEFHDCRSVVDIGGRSDMWADITFAERVTLLNVGSPPDNLPSRFNYVQGDGRDTKLPSYDFDLAFSNSTIEHVGNLEDQRRFANEMLRLGRRVYCQTPNKWFPVEPHFFALFVHWLPRKWFTATIYRYFTLHGWIAKPDRMKCEELISSARLLTKKELVQLFPGCKIKVERFLWLPKSYIAIR